MACSKIPRSQPAVWNVRCRLTARIEYTTLKASTNDRGIRRAVHQWRRPRNRRRLRGLIAVPGRVDIGCLRVTVITCLIRSDSSKCWTTAGTPRFRAPIGRPHTGNAVSRPVHIVAARNSDRRKSSERNRSVLSRNPEPVCSARSGSWFRFRSATPFPNGQSHHQRQDDHQEERARSCCSKTQTPVLRAL
jgi:hypothetical protein